MSSESECVETLKHPNFRVKNNDIIGIGIDTAGGILTFIGPGFEEKTYPIQINEQWRVGVMLLDGVQVQILKKSNFINK